MQHKNIRVTLLLIEAFIGISAVGGGIAVLTGVFDQWLPISLLQGTPFSNYFIPGLILTVVVGGGMLFAAAAQFVQRAWATLLSAGMGIVMIGWIIGEVVILDRYAQAVAPSTLVQQILFSALGLVIFVQATHLWMIEYRNQRVSTRHI